MPSAMVQVEREEFDAILKWISGANNYDGVSSHDVDGTSYYMLVGGVRKHALRHDQSEDEIFLADPLLYVKWREMFGYSINF